MQSQDHLRRVLRSELQLNKRKVRSYKSEYWADGIKLRGRSNEIGLFVDIRDVSTRKGICGIDVYEKTEPSDPADETAVFAQISTCQTTGLLPNELVAGCICLLPNLVQVCSKCFLVDLYLYRQGTRRGE